MANIKRHYVYELRERTATESKVFYVGKGVGNRVENHADTVRTKLQNTTLLDGKKEMHIASLLGGDATGELEELIIGRFDTDDEAKAVESTLIDWIYGRANLTNINGGKGAAYIRNIGNFDQDNLLDDAQPNHEQILQDIERLCLKDAAEELRSNLQDYGLHDTTEPALVNGQDFTFNWSLPGTDFYIQFKMTMSRDNVVLNARPNNGAAPEFVKQIEAAGYLLSNKGGANVYAPLAEYKNKPCEVSEPLEGGARKLSSYLRGVPRCNVEDIVRLVQDFRIRLNLAKVTLLLSDSQGNSVSEVSSLVENAIDIFKQRPEEKHDSRLPQIE